MGHLYRLDFASGKSYIGITKHTAIHRFERHRREAARGVKWNPVYNAWREHGEPTLVVMAVLINEDLAETEIRAIALFNTMLPHGYNLSAGGEIS